MKNSGKSESVKLALVLLISCSIPLIVSAIMGKSPFIQSPTIIFVFWTLINFLFVTAVQELLNKYSKLFKLKNLKTNKVNLFINFFVYLAFLVFVNLYFLQQLYIRDNTVINRITDINTLFILLILFVLNLSCGQAPDEDIKENVRSYTLNKKSSFKLGREKFGILIGSFNDGIVIGSYPFYFKNIKTVYIDKKTDSLIIKGKDNDGNFRISIEIPKSREAAEKILINARKTGKINENKINI